MMCIATRSLRQTAGAVVLMLSVVGAHADVAASIKLKAAAAGGAAQIDPPIAGLSDTSSTPVNGVLTLTVTCAANVTCANVTAKLGTSADIGGAVGPNGERIFKVDQTTLPPAGAKLHVSYQAQVVKSFDLVPAAAGQQPGQPQVQDAAASSLQDLLACDASGITKPDDYKPYDAKNNEAWFIVSPLGTMIDGPSGADGGIIDEDDTVYITLYVNPALKDLLRVKRTSAARTLGGFSIAGEGTEIQRFSGVKCEPYTIYLRDFAPGVGAVKISAQLGDKEVETGSFDFSVSKLFRGILSFGALSSDRMNDSFILAPNNGQNVIATGSEGGKETSYAVWYTGFVWGRRDLEKADTQWYHHINPAIGFGTSNPDRNVLVGLTVDWNGFLLHVGRHYTREKVLSSASGLNIGDPFAGTADQIPVADHWDSSTYVGLAVDFRAAAALVKSALGSK